LLLATTILAAPTGESQYENLALEARGGSRPSTPTGSSQGEKNYEAIKHLTTEVGWHAFQYVWDKVDQKDPDM